MANVILDNVSINQPVADAAARMAIPTVSLTKGVIVEQQDDLSLWVWNGTAWQSKDFSQAQADWSQSNTSDPSYIKKKPNIIPAVATIGDLPSGQLPNTLCYVNAKTAWYLYNGDSWVTQDISGISQFGGEAKGETTVKSLFDNGVRAVLVSENVTETAQIVLGASDQLFVQIAQNTTWDISTFSIAGTSNNSLTIILTDSSSVFKYNMPSGSPFSNFDINSYITIIANAGTILNTSTVDNTAIKIDGVLYLDNFTFVLPNALNGGINTNVFDEIHSASFYGTGALCEKAFIAKGGNYSDISYTGTFKDNAFLNDVDVVGGCNVDNLYIDLDQSYNYVDSGNTTNVTFKDNFNTIFVIVSASSSSSSSSSVAEEIKQDKSEKYAQKIQNYLSKIRGKK